MQFKFIEGGVGSVDADSRIDQNTVIQGKQQKAPLQVSKLPIIGRTRAAASENIRKQKERENEIKTSLVITNSKPGKFVHQRILNTIVLLVIDMEAVPHNNIKSFSTASSPVALKNTTSSHPKPVPRGPRNSTKVTEFKLVAPSSNKKNEEAPGDIQALNNETQEGATPTKKENPDFSKSLHTDTPLAGDPQNNNDTSTEVSMKLMSSSMVLPRDHSSKHTQEEISQNDDSTKDPSVKETQSDASSQQTNVNKENNPSTAQKFTSPNPTRKTYHSKTKMEEGKSVILMNFIF